MLIEVLAPLFVGSLAFIFFGHLKDAPAAFVAGGMLLAITGALVASDGIDVMTIKNVNSTQSLSWKYNTTYNFSYFDSVSTNQTQTAVFTEVAKNISANPLISNTIWLSISLVGAFYILIGAATLLSKKDVGS